MNLGRKAMGISKERIERYCGKEFVVDAPKRGESQKRELKAV